MEKQYIIGEKQLKQLLKTDEKMDAMDAGGVDNWEWMGEALEDYDSDEAPDLSSYSEYKGAQ